MNFLTKKQNTGFTLIELIVSIGIISLITGVVLYKQKGFSDQLSVLNTASDIELVIREAQSYSIAVREFAASSDEFTVAYGISANLRNNGSSNTSYLSFVDRGALNNYYDTPTACTPGPTSECLQRNNLSGQNTISDICVIRKNNQSCGNSIARLDISFQRPSPNAILTFFNAGGNPTPQPQAIGARIELTSPAGITKNVYIYTSGQIAVQ